jgi:hypothetical protein
MTTSRQEARQQISAGERRKSHRAARRYGACLANGGTDRGAWGT